MSRITRYGFSREAGRAVTPVPLVRRPVMGAMRIHKGWWPGLERAVILPAPTGAMGDLGTAFPDWPDAPLPDEFEMVEAGGCAPPVLVSRAKAGVEAAAGRACEAAVEPASRSGRGRSRPATSEPMDVTAGETAPDCEMPAGGIQTADAGSGREGSAPEGSSGAHAGEGGNPANAEQSQLPVSEPGTVGSFPPVAPAALAPPAPAIAPAGAGGEPDDDDEFAAAVARARAKREAMIQEVRKPAARPDFARVAAAARARPIGPSARKAPTRRALSADPCERCGIPGFRGCDHQLPFEDWTPPTVEEAEDGRKAKGRLGGQTRKGGRSFRI